MTRLENEHIDLYEPRTQKERSYMQGIASAYQNDCIDDAATIAANAMKRSVIGSIEVHTQDAELELDELD